MFKKILVFYLLVCVFMCKETYASKRHDETGIEKLNKKKINIKERTIISLNYFLPLILFLCLNLFL